MAEVKTKENTQAQAVRKAARRSVRAGGGQTCPYCDAEVPKGAEICPECGARLVDYCTFCGSPMDKSQAVCDECGMPAAGVTCPDCGTLNHRSFCRKCNRPLTRAAVRALERAKADPKFQKACQMAQRAAELEARLAEPAPVPTEGEIRLMEMLGQKVEFTDAAQVRQEYEQLVKDLDQLFEEMLPPPGSTPQEQRNYYSARKIAITSTVKTKTLVKDPIEWVCNYCGCHHGKPSECVEPELGGKWIYSTREVETTVTTVDYKYEE